MTVYTRYASRTGRILDWINLPTGNEDAYDLHSALLYEGEVDQATHYIVDGSPVSRPGQDTVIDTDTISVSQQTAATLSALPNPCSISIDGPTGHHEVAVEDGGLEFTASLAGDYVLTISAFPYLDRSFTVHAI